MLEDKIIQAATEEFKQKLRHALENLSMATLTPELATQVSQGLQESICSAALVGYRTFLESYKTGEYAMPQVQECVLLATAHLTPKEAASLLKKSSLFHPSATAINNMIEENGELIEAHLDELQHTIRDGEEVPQQTQVVVASMDGVNVLMREPGKKSGRPKERPDKPEANPEPASTYKNAMVGSISFYGIGDRNIWSYLDQNARYNEYEKLVDFYHR